MSDQTPPTVSCLLDARCTLGEGPVWDEREERLWWVDVKAPAIHVLAPRTGEHHSWPAPDTVSAVALREGGGLVAALKSGFHFFDPKTGRFEAIGNPQADQPGNRLNDAKCDALGRFWAGGMDDAEDAATGDLFRLDSDLGWQRTPMGFVVTNGPAWSGDGRTFYLNDSAGRRIYAYEFDAAEGRIGGRRLFAAFGAEEGHPDGQCVDEEDGLWTAHWDGARITRRRPDGSLVQVLPLPAPRITSCCFGGPDLDVLYVTSARIGLDEEELERSPLSGAVFEVRGLGVRGRPMHRFAG